MHYINQHLDRSFIPRDVSFTERRSSSNLLNWTTPHLADRMPKPIRIINDDHGFDFCNK